MELTEIIGYFLALLVGVSLGMLGSGGSILAVPILVYIMKIEPVLATGYSLFIVGFSALIGGLQKIKQKLVDFNKVVLFGIPTIISVYCTRRYIVPNLPNVIFETEAFVVTKSVFIMIFFAVVMILAAIKMIQPLKVNLTATNESIPFVKIMLLGISIGLVAGFVGAGGGFLIVPTLVLFAKTPMKKAVGTSLFIVALQSLIGFIGDLQGNQTMDWKLIIVFTSISLIGIIIGNFLSKKIEGKKLKKGFGYFVLSMAFYIFFKELF